MLQAAIVIFLVHLPLGIVSFVVIGVMFHARTQRGKPSIDHVGAAAMLPAGASAPKNATPAAVAHLPPALHETYVAAVAASIRPVFEAAVVVGVVAFLLGWLVREVPLQYRRRGGRRTPALTTVTARSSPAGEA